MAKVSRTERLFSTIGAVLHILFVAGPQDLWNWAHSNLKSVNGRCVVITGAASGIGKRLAEIFAVQLGAKVAVLDIDKHGAQETVKKIIECGGIAQCWKCDISNAEEVNECARQIHAAYGCADIVICNAAVLYFGQILDLTTSQLQKSVNVNIMGTMNTIRAFLHSMIQRNEGQIVAVSSIAGFCGETNGAAYCPSKFAIRGVMQCVEMEMKDRGLNGIRCTTVCPYFTRTPMILNMGMRPTSIWIPFMSIERCAQEIVDAILREKNVAFVPHYISIIAQLKDLLSERVADAGRKYLNCRYEPRNDQAGENQEITLSKKSDYFKGLSECVKYVLLFVYSFLLVGCLLTQGMMQSMVRVVLVFTVSSNLAMAICALHICDQLQFSFSCTFRWFSQILCFGFVSLLELYRFHCAIVTCIREHSSQNDGHTSS